MLENEPKNYFMGDNGKLKMGILPVSIFCSGHTYFVQRMAERLKLQPYAVHATFQFSGGRLGRAPAAAVHPSAKRKARGGCRGLWRAVQQRCRLFPTQVACTAQLWSSARYHVQHSHTAWRLSQPLTQRAPPPVGTPGKRNRMRERLLWHDPPVYFDYQPGFVTFKLDVPEALLKNAGPRTKKMNVENSDGHFELVNHQITQVGGRPVLRCTALCGTVPHGGVHACPCLHGLHVPVRQLVVADDMPP